MAEPLTREDAQERVEQIAAFRQELAQLANEDASPFTPAQLDAVAAHHDALLERLSGEFDVDRTVQEQRMSVGMRLASLFGAATLTAAVVSFMYHVWGSIPTPAQVALLTSAPMIAVVVMVVAGRLERTRYVSALMAIVACGAFVLQTMLVPQVFNLRGTPHVLGLWALFAFVVAAPWRFSLPFGLGVLALACYLAALPFWWMGAAWNSFGQRPESLMIVAAALLAGVRAVPREVTVATRAVLLVTLLGPLLLLASYGRLSLLPGSPDVIRVIYQGVAAVVAVAIVWAGVRRGQDDVVVIGSIFTALFLFVRFVDWWWDWMPRYLFFLVLSAVALAWLFALRLVRRAARAS